jgi:hypothetical protein
VLERIFAERDAATRRVFAPLVAWAREGGAGSVSGALRQAVTGYCDFLQRRPEFVRLVQFESLSGGQRLQTARRESSAMTEAFQEVRVVSRQRRLQAFSVEDAVLLFVSLTFSPLTQRTTLMATLRRDLADPCTREKHVAFVVDHLLHLIERPG